MQYEIQENCLTIFLPPEVDHHSAEEIKRESDKLIKDKHIKYVIFDFGGTNFMDSSGIGVMMGRYRLLELLGGEVWAVHLSERMKKILKMSGIAKIIRIDEEDEKI
ncbi:MAG: anti-sigma factor antagonist [Lachnospiraceae bacterium]|nr:anti-sigma factor antagonist [Lachnospiraceae bacterium]